MTPITPLITTEDIRAAVSKQHIAFCNLSQAKRTGIGLREAVATYKQEVMNVATLSADKFLQTANASIAKESAQ